MSVSKQENSFGGLPDIEATYNGSSVLLYNYDELMTAEGIPSATVLLEETDFLPDTPITRLFVTSTRRKLADDSGNYGTTFRADIDIQDISDEQWEDFLLEIQDPNSEFTEITDNIGLEEDARQRGHYRLFAVGDAWLTIEVNPDVPHVTIHTEPDGEVELYENESEEAASQAKFFMSSLARMLDIAGGAYLEKPMDFRHNRTYTMAYEADARRQLEKPASAALVPTVGKAATQEVVATVEVAAPGEGPISFDDIAGYKDLKERLSKIATAYSMPEVFAKWGARRPAGILLEGPGGTGKTTLLYAICNAANATPIEVNSHEIYGKYIGDSDKNFNELLDRTEALAAKGKRTMLVFDEMDTLIHSDTGSNMERAAVRGSFKRRMPRISGNPNIIVGATTNERDAMDQTLLRSGRFDIKILVPLPDEQDRLDIVLSRLDTPGLEFEVWSTLNDGTNTASIAPSELTFHSFSAGIDVTKIVEATKGFSGADIVNLINRVCFDKAIQEITGDTPGPVTQAEIDYEVSRMRDEGIGKIDGTSSV